MIEVVFNTGNEGKWKIAKEVFSQYGVSLGREKIDTPEIQALKVEDVASYSAAVAAKECAKPVIKSDVGYYIKALNGFPGPYIKFINQWLESEDILRLLEGKSNREIVIEEAIALATPEGDVEIFSDIDKGEVAVEPAGEGQSIDRVIIRSRQDKQQALYSAEEMFDYWTENLEHYHQAAKFIANKYQENKR